MASNQGTFKLKEVYQKKNGMSQDPLFLYFSDLKVLLTPVSL